MYNYTISKKTDEEIFNKQCIAIEKHITFLEKEPLLVDVDGTMIQEYKKKDLQIKVVNDFQMNAVYVESNEAIDHYFK